MQRTGEIRARVFESEQRALELIAEREGRNPTDVIRDLVINKAKEYNLWPPYRVRQSSHALVDPGVEYETEAA